MQLNGSFDVKLGKTFLDKDSNSYMTMRCDFMPASVDRSRPGSIKVSDGKEVVVSLLNVANTGSDTTVFRGIARPVQKECVLIYNKKTQEFTLERIGHTVQLKKTREERKTDSTTTTVSSSNNEVIQSDHNASTKVHVSTKKKNHESLGTTSKPLKPVINKSSSHRRTLSSSSSSSSSGSENSSSDKSSPSRGGGRGGSGGGDGVVGSIHSKTQINSSHVNNEDVGSAKDETDDESSSSSLSSLSSDDRKYSRRQNVNARSGGVGSGGGGHTHRTASHQSPYNNAVHRKLIEQDLKLSDSESELSS